MTIIQKKTTTWRKEFYNLMGQFNENWADVTHSTLTRQQLDREFSYERGDANWPAQIWTKDRVYFATLCECDGLDNGRRMGVVCRHPEARLKWANLPPDEPGRIGRLIPDPVPKYRP